MNLGQFDSALCLMKLFNYRGTNCAVYSVTSDFLSALPPSLPMLEGGRVSDHNQGGARL